VTVTCDPFLLLALMSERAKEKKKSGRPSIWSNKDKVFLEKWMEKYLNLSGAHSHTAFWPSVFTEWWETHSSENISIPDTQKVLF